MVIAIDIFIDGLLVGIAFSVDYKEGLLLTIAIGIELFSLGLATAFRKQKAVANGKRSCMWLY